MNRIHLERERIVREIFSAIPDLFGLKFFHFTDRTYFRSERCIIRFGWERYEAQLCSIEFSDPLESEESSGMSFWILQHILGIRIAESDRPYFALGRALVDHCDSLLQGDFSVRTKYETLEEQILDKMDEVLALPLDHPARMRFEECDLRWLEDFENQS